MVYGSERPEVSPKQTPGPRRRDSVVAHNFRVAQDSGMILWTAEMAFPGCEAAILRLWHCLAAWGALWVRGLNSNAGNAAEDALPGPA